MSARSAPSTEITQATDTVIKTIVDLVQHTGVEKLKLVDAKLIPLVQWAMDYAGYRFRHKEIIRILRDEGQLNDLSDQLRRLAEDSLQAGDAFVLARAEADWEGDWVHPRWKKAAMERAQAAEKQRKEDLLVAERRRVDVYTRLRDVCNTNIEDLPFNYSEDSDSEDEILQAASVGAPGPSSSSHSTVHNPASRTSTSNLTKPRSAIPGNTSIVNIAPQAGPDAQQQKRKAEAFLHGDFNKRSRPDRTLYHTFSVIIYTSNPIPDSTLRAALPKRPGIPVPSVPVQHPLLPFNFRGLSKEAQQISNFKQYQKTHSGDIVQTLNVHFNGSTNLTANEAYVREISQTLPSCVACTRRKIKCVWIFDRARCEFCSGTSKHLKCSFGDTLRWHRACGQLPDHEPSEIRKVFEQTSFGNGNLDPFWYEKIIDGHRSPYVSSSDSSDTTLLSA
ncbi:hypothetical protein EV368DRAFT_84480 [Lentinula lateritia]|nr:hypothetical protein EV368DRAFT_84480 [Lentinula lateritia]